VFSLKLQEQDNKRSLLGVIIIIITNVIRTEAFMKIFICWDVALCHLASSFRHFEGMSASACPMKHLHIPGDLCIYIYLFTVIGLLPGGSGYFTCKQNMKLVTTRFKSGGLHEKHVMATWNFGNHLSIYL